MAYKDEVLLSLPAGYWRLGEVLASEGAKNEVPGKSSGTYNAAIVGAPGLLEGDANTAANFGKTLSHYIEAPDADYRIAGDITVEAWIKPASLDLMSVASKYDGNGDSGWLLLVSGAGKASFDGRDKGGAYRSSGASSVVLQANQVYHLVGVRQGTSWRIYVNGQLESSGTGGTGTIAAVGAPLRVGGQTIVTTQTPFHGVIDEPAIYPRALSEWEIRRHYWAGKGRKGYELDVLSGGPLGFWPLDEGPSQGSAVALVGGNLSHAGNTITGAPPLHVGSNTSARYFAADQSRSSGTTVPTAYPFTLEAWFKTSATGHGGVILSLANKASDAQIYGLRLFGGQPQIAARNTTYYAGTAPTTANDDTPHHIVGVFESATSRKLYVDGRLVATSTENVPFIGALNDITVGRFSDSTPGDYFQGEVDAPALYPRALSEWEIRRHYLLGVGRKGYGLEALSSGPVGYWRLGDVGGSQAADSSGNAINGAVAGGAAVPGFLAQDANGAWVQTGSGMITVPSDARLAASAPFAVEFWVQYTAATNLVVLERGGSNGWSVQISQWAPNIGGLLMSVGGGSRNILTKSAWNDGKPHHVLFLVNGANSRVYVDGRDDTVASPNPGTPAYAWPELTLGGRQGSGSLYFGGYLDEVAVYPHAVTPEELIRRYAMGLYGPGDVVLLYYLAGIITLDGSPAAALVRAYRRDTGELLGEAESDAGDGSYSLTLDYDGEVDVLAIGPEGYRPLAHGPVIPEQEG